MPKDRFMIAPLQGGLNTSLKPWMITDDSFARLQNAYIFRGRVRKRFGSRLMNGGVEQSISQLFSRLRIQVATMMTGAASGTVPGSQFNKGQIFSVGTDIFTVYQTGTPAAMLSTNASASGTFNTTTGQFSITDAGQPDSTPVFWYPSLPVMGLITYQTSISQTDPTYAFDTQFAYQFNPSNSGGWDILGPIPPAANSGLWTGSNAQFFWGWTWQGASSATRYLFVVNNNPPDLIQYWNLATNQWNSLNPVISFSGNVLTVLQTALIVIAFKNRLVALNTTETVMTGTNLGNTDGSGNGTGTIVGGGKIGDYFTIGTQIFRVNLPSGTLQVFSGAGTGTFNITTGAWTFTGAAATTAIYYYSIATGTQSVFTNRARYAAFGDPTAPTAWRQDIPGQGNAVDAATMEDIVSCEFVKDRLDVFFERSTWELAFTNNQAQPFTWNQLNTELGAESTWSIVPFDKIALAIGNVGIHACNGVNVQRIDDKIPDSVWTIHSGQSSTERVYGIRDYYVEQVYWTFPNIDADPSSQTFPNQVLVYNYKTGSWAINDDSITAFGYYYAATQSAIIWDNTDVTWDNTEITWDGGTAQALNQEIVAGNQEGFVFIVDANQTQNAPALSITNIIVTSGNVTLTVINHNFNVADFIFIQFLNGLTGPFTGYYKIVSISDANTFVIIAPDVRAALLNGQTYTGGGTIARVSRIDIFTKQFNFYVQEDRNAMIERVDFLVDRTDLGEITVDYSTSTTSPQSDGLVESAIATGSILGTSVLETSPYALYPFEADQDRVWHPVYISADGECVQLRLYLSDAELANGNIATSAFQLHAMTFYTMRTASRLQ